MPTTCVIPGCRSGYRQTKKDSDSDKEESPIFFKFPQESEIRKQWIDVVKKIRKDYEPTKHSRVCHKHFSPENFVTESQDSNNRRKKKRLLNRLSHRRLKKAAIPHIFPNLPKYLSTSQPKQRSSRATRESRFDSILKRQEAVNDDFLSRDLVSHLDQLYEKLSNETLPSGIAPFKSSEERIDILCLKESSEKGILCIVNFFDISLHKSFRSFRHLLFNRFP
jgi:hypothetical protein